MNSRVTPISVVLLAVAGAVGVALADESPGSEDTARIATSTPAWHIDQTWRDERLLDWTNPLGTAFGERIVAPLSVHGLSLDLEDKTFVRAGIDYSQTLSAAIGYRQSSRLSFRLGINADHLETPRDSGDPLLSQLGVDAGNDSRSRWTFPVSAALVYSFD